MIDTTSLAKFGNMTSGGGLSAAISADASSGYYPNTAGWLGVVLDNPERIKRVIATSPSNGFDASGLTTPITLSLYAKQGLVPPVNPYDGQKLGEIKFTDVNAVSDRSVFSFDLIKRWKYVWIVNTTGSWSAIQALQIEEAPAPALLPLPNPLKPSLYRKSFPIAVALPWTMAELTDLRLAPLQLDFPAIVSFRYIFEVVHQNLVTNNFPSGYGGPIGIGFALRHRFGATIDDLANASLSTVSHLVSTTQIASIEHHYSHAARFGALSLAPGFHQIGFSGTAHTSADPSNGHAKLLVESGVGRNSLMIEVNPQAELFEI